MSEEEKKGDVDVAEDVQPEQTETRHLILVTDGNRVQIKSCTMGLLEQKATLEMYLNTVNQTINQIAAADNRQRVAKPSAPEEEAKEPDSPVSESEQ